ncbi:hypothetical protein BXZ70DRAFT_1006622 [Cristinia sonorae]|uniref:Transmembrane protein n=1 Tax=Cristinia sonorae TaxID=1940300 RepID=A0A8K0XRN7_9AGAR|nr:hypothetical protein BXZ70DRAFT_1006622 [Cristinia sonorae]
MTLAYEQIYQYFTFLIILFTCTTTASVGAQSTNATCEPSFDWMSNSRGQNPCLVTAYLHGPCLTDPARATVSRLSAPGHFYIAPKSGRSDGRCRCSTVYYSLLAACAICQNGRSLPWSTWTTNCTADEVYNEGYPETIPPETAVPSWAYLDVSHTNNFNATAALVEKLANHPEITSQTTMESLSSSPSLFPAATSKPASSGPIIRGLIGGLGGLAVSVVVALFGWRWHQRRRVSTSVLDPTRDLESSGNDVHDSGVCKRASRCMGFEHTAPITETTVTYVPNRLYDPNDPSTYPVANKVARYSLPAPHQYSGSPEV